jgi:Tol biopolymer transport system component/DNA-binding winged helix-turn-helix (wHTH) protein
MQARPHKIYRFDRFELDVHRRQLQCDGQPVELQPKALDLLVALAEGGGRLLTKDELLNLVWPDQLVEESNLTVHMSALRKALGERRGEHRFVVTAAGQGYRFIPDVTVHSSSSADIGRDTGRTDVPANAVADDARHVTDPADRTGAGAPGRRGRRLAVVAGLATASVALALVGFLYLAVGRSSAPFQQFTLSRLTSNGSVLGVTLAPDGKYAAYVLAEAEGNSLWVQQVGTASTLRVVPPIQSEFWSVMFSPDGAYLYYSLFAGHRADVELFRVPSLGGLVQQRPNFSAPAFAVSPDGTRIAHTNSYSAMGKTFLQVADTDGGNGRQVAERQAPFNFEIRGHVLSWSPDGKTLASVVNHHASDAHYSSIVGVDVNTGVERPLSAARWFNVYGLQWRRDGSGLFIVAGDQPTSLSQVWFVTYPSGRAHRITNDLSEYGWLGVASDGQALVTLQTSAINSLWVETEESGVRDFELVLSESGPLSPFVSLLDGRFVFRSQAGGRSDLWIMNADGTSRRQLTVDAQVSPRGVCASPDGKYVVYSSWRDGLQNLWRADADDGHVTRLTSGDGEAYPSCSPDGRWVVYQSGLAIGKPTVWRVALSGGTPEPLVDTFSSKPVVSNDGERIAYFYLDDDKWRIGILSARDRTILQRLDLPASVAERVMRWAPDDQALYYVNTVGNVGNVWSLPLDGAPAWQLTRFTSQRVEDFQWSPDRHHLSVIRRIESRDAVLLNDVR